jgi:hypothetical protein
VIAEKSVVFVIHRMDVASAYELMHSAKIRDALAREMARKNR